MKLLVTGGLGFIGSNFIRLMLRQREDFQILNIDNLDSSKIGAQLHWHPQKDFADGFEETVNWYMGNEKWWRPLMDDRVLDPTPWKLDWCN